MNSIFGVLAKKVGVGGSLDEKKLEEMKEAFVDAVGKSVAGVKKVGIMFSGGIDSTLIATVAKDSGSDITLYSVGTEGSEDLAFAEKVNAELGLRLRKKVLDKDALIEVYKKVRGMIDRKDLLNLELAIPVFLCTEMAREDGITVMLEGAGAEELFAGYDRHLQCYMKGGDLGKLLWEELVNLHKTDLERNNQVAALNHCELRYPFLDLKFIKAVKSVKPELNLSRKGEKKLVLRRIAKELGTPEAAYNRPKKAMQYGSGIHKILIGEKRKNLINM